MSEYNIIFYFILYMYYKNGYNSQYYGHKAINVRSFINMYWIMEIN